MCLQDLQLERSQLIETYEFATTGATNALMLPSNPQRTGIIITGPASGTLDIALGSLASRRFIGRYTVTTLDIMRSLTIRDWGPAIQLPIFYVASAAMVWTVFEYSLPVDPESLKRLAATGKW